MFYSHELLSKRGPLGTIWLAGVYLRKLSKQAVLSSDLSAMCGSVERPPVQLALPTQSTLLKGVVNIENKKAHYLLGQRPHRTQSPRQPHSAAHTVSACLCVCASECGRECTGGRGCCSRVSGASYHTVRQSAASAARCDHTGDGGSGAC